MAYGLQCDPDKLRSVIEDFDLFIVEDGYFYSRRLNDHIQDINNKSKRAKQNASKRWSNATAMQPQNKSNASKSISISKQDKSKSKSINNRIISFENEIQAIKGFNKDDKNDFFLYWTEKNKSETKFRAELEKTFDIKRRLTRWCNNGFSKSSKDKFPDHWDLQYSRKLPDEAKRTEYYNHLKSIGWTSVYSPNAGMVWKLNKK